MTLAKGDHLLKLNPLTKQPIKDEEVYVEWEIVELSPTFAIGLQPEVGQFLLVKKVR